MHTSYTECCKYHKSSHLPYERLCVSLRNWWIINRNRRLSIKKKNSIYPIVSHPNNQFYTMNIWIDRFASVAPARDGNVSYDIAVSRPWIEFCTLHTFLYRWYGRSYVQLWNTNMSAGFYWFKIHKNSISFFYPACRFRCIEYGTRRKIKKNFCCTFSRKIHFRFSFGPLRHPMQRSKIENE